MLYTNKNIVNLLISGFNNLFNNYPKIDKLNVFPVPDGDTGTNMFLTMKNAVANLENKDKNNEQSLDKLLDAFARDLIMGARGNSGVILSQIFRGFANGFKKNNEFTTINLKKSLLLARDVAYNAVMKPVEGTILTVIRETAEKCDELDNEMPVLDFFEKVCAYSKVSLKGTPDLLPILKEVGVVDSGGYGLVKIFEGMSYYLKNNKVISKVKQHEENTGNNINLVNHEEEFGYCTEVLIIFEEKDVNNVNINHVRKSLEDQGGTSVVAVIDSDIMKIHVHTLVPGNALTFLQQFGEFEKVKIENMTLQAEEHVNYVKDRKLVNKEALISVVPSIAIGNYFKQELKAAEFINGGFSMNPSTDDFLSAIEKVDAQNVFLFPNNSNAILAAQQAAKVEKKSKIYVVPTISIQEGMVSMISYDYEETPKKNFSILKQATKLVQSIAITTASKSTTMDGVKITKDSYIGLDGKKIVISNASMKKVIVSLFDKFISKSSEIITIFYGEDVEISTINFIKKYLDENFDIEYEIIDGEQSLYQLLIAIE